MIQEQQVSITNKVSQLIVDALIFQVDSFEVPKTVAVSYY